MLNGGFFFTSIFLFVCIWMVCPAIHAMGEQVTYLNPSMGEINLYKCDAY